MPEEEPPLDLGLLPIDEEKTYRDTVSGELLDPVEVRAAMAEEEAYMRSLPVWEDITREDFLPGDRPVPCKWVFKRGPPVRAGRGL